MILSAVSLFILAWKVSYELVDLFGIQDELKYMFVLLVLMILGVGIIIASIGSGHDHLLSRLSLSPRHTDDVQLDAPDGGRSAPLLWDSSPAREVGS